MTDQIPPKGTGKKKVAFTKVALDDFEEFYKTITDFGKALGIKESSREEIRAIWEKDQKKKTNSTS